MAGSLETMASRRLVSALLQLPALGIAGAALAQAELNTKPYDPIQGTYDRTVANDPALKARIETVRQAVADGKLAPIQAMVSSGYVALSCSIDPIAPCSPGYAKTIGKAQMRPAERMRIALCCEGEVSSDASKQDQDEAVIGFFATVLEENTIGTHPDVPGAACLPALAKFDHAKATQIIKATGIEPENLRIAGADMQLRQKPAEDAPVIQEVKTDELLPLVVALTTTMPAGWNSVAMPKGGLGYTDQIGMNELTPPAVCFSRDGRGEWEIAFTIQRGG